MKESGKARFEKGMELRFGQMGPNMRVNGKITKLKGKGNFGMLMVIYMKVQIF